MLHSSWLRCLLFPPPFRDSSLLVAKISSRPNFGPSEESEERMFFIGGSIEQSLQKKLIFRANQRRDSTGRSSDICMETLFTWLGLTLLCARFHLVWQSSRELIQSSAFYKHRLSHSLASLEENCYSAQPRGFRRRQF